MRKSLCILIGLLLAFRASAGTVIWSDSDDVHFGTGEWSGEYSSKAKFNWDLYGSYAYCEFYIKGRHAYGPEIRLLAHGTNALLMNEGDPVDHTTTFGTDKTYYYAELQEGGTESPLRLPTRTPILLGFATVNYGDKAYGDYIYGWIRLVFDGVNLQLDSSAVAIGTDVAGIYAGTGIIIPRQIPEPSISVLALIGIAGLLFRRKCH